MGGPTSWATIEFPVSAIDKEIKALLEEDGVEFNGLIPIENGRDWEPGTEIEGGIFNLHASDISDGEFTELEAMLRGKGVPFDRQTGMDWGIGAHTRIYRPGPPEFYHYYQQDDDGVVLVSVEEIRKMLPAGAYAAQAITDYLNEHFPAYPPLEDFVKEATS